MTTSQYRVNTLLDSLWIGCETDPRRVAYTVLGDGENESENCTYADLLMRVRRVAAGLREQSSRGSTVLLLINNPLRFIEVFLGCLWVGVVPVPAAVPRRAQSVDSIRAISQDAQAKVFVTDNGTLSSLWSDHQPLLDVRWISVEQLASASPYTGDPERSPNDTAFLQYTSGSTGHPKGVVVTHANLISNQRAIYQAMQTHRESIFLGWLPLHHDMGLIGNVLQPLYATARCVILSPVAFLQRPVRWLRAISKYRATNSGGPNFAYELCVQKIPVEARTELDLSSWDVAYNGSEPVRADTIERFCSAFGMFGFRRGAAYPCYGLAESTLFVTGSKPGTGPRFSRVDKAQLESGRAVVVTDGACQSVELVSSGVPALETQVAIVDPHTRKILDDGNIGEIWVSSASVAAGYFNRERQSRKQFAARLAGTRGPRFLRTGDLGFLRDGALYVTGRIKDVIVCRGRNHYAHDLEVTALRSNPYLARGAAAALTVDNEDGESLLYLVCELTRHGWRNAELRDVAADVREAIAVEHGLQVNKVLLIRPGTLPRTTSGKIRRATCREMILADSFENPGVTKTQSVEPVRPHDAMGPM